MGNGKDIYTKWLQRYIRFGSVENVFLLLRLPRVALVINCLFSCPQTNKQRCVQYSLFFNETSHWKEYLFFFILIQLFSTFPLFVFLCFCFYARSATARGNQNKEKGPKTEIWVSRSGDSVNKPNTMQSHLLLCCAAGGLQVAVLGHLREKQEVTVRTAAVFFFCVKNVTRCSFVSSDNTFLLFACFSFFSGEKFTASYNFFFLNFT